MPSFLSRAACAGRRPAHLAARRHYPRPDLVARLLRERQVVRFLVAPDGFGKTEIAMEYADVVYSFHKVFWLNGRSPCFLRDLDRGAIASTLCAIEGDPFLVVIDDIPQLNASRASALSVMFDALLERGCEILATCTPSCDTFESLQPDRLKLSARDMLLTDAEIDALRSSDDRAMCPAGDIAAAQRVPGLCWLFSDAKASFLVDTLNEELPLDVLLALSSMLVLMHGSLSELEAFGPVDTSLLTMLDKDYPHTGINWDEDEFEAAEFSVETIAAALANKLEELAVRSRFSSRDALVKKWADALVARDECERACTLMEALCMREARMDWLSARTGELLRRASMFPAHKLFESLGKMMLVNRAFLEFGEAVRLLALGNSEVALVNMQRLAFDRSCPLGVRALATIITLRKGRQEVCEHAVGELRDLLNSAKLERLSVPASDTAEKDIAELFWIPLAKTQLAFENGAEWYEAWADTSRTPPRLHDVAMVAAFWALEEAMKERVLSSSEHQANRLLALARIERFLGAYVSRADEVHRDLIVASAGLALERAREKGVLALKRPLSAEVLFALHQKEMELFSQERLYQKSLRTRQEKRSVKLQTHPDAFLDARQAHGVTVSSKAPLLTVNLFGGLDVRVGDTAIDPRLFRRRKVKILLALLVLNRGREIPRDRLVSALWPESDLDSARKNFYCIWSQLRRTLSGPSGTCPYLVRQQNGCRLDERLLRTDVARFDTVCRMLLFGQPGGDGWGHVYAEIEEAFADDLLPSETENEQIIHEREMRRIHLVDGLIAAARRLVAEDGIQEGLWFARAALHRDYLREDAYYVLMKAQIAAGQRSAALETYFTCRRVLADELGIDPSIHLVNLYNSMILVEEVMS